MKTLIVIFVTIYLIFFVKAKFTCPAGTKIIQRFEPTKNGCGPDVKNEFFKVLNDLGRKILERFQGCCDNHDTCYDSCGDNQENCDTTFKTCMQDHCSGLGTIKKLLCKGEAYTLYLLVSKLGSKYYDAAQGKNCKCA
jgi:secretory phospholipase A2